MNKNLNTATLLSLITAIALLMMGTLVPATVGAQEVTAENSSDVNTTTRVERPINKPLPVVRQNIKAVQQEKRTDVKAINAEAAAKIKEERLMLQEAQLKAKIDGLSAEERAKMMEARKGTMVDIKNIRAEQFAEVKMRREEAQIDIKQAVETRRMKMASTTDAKKEERKQKAVEKAANLAEKMIKRLSAAIERLEKLSVRIESRIEKVKAAGGVTTEAEASLAKANVSIQAAKDGLATISAAFAAAATSEAPKDGVRKMQEEVEAVNAHIKAAAQFLRETVKNLEGKKGIEVAASVV